MSNPFNPRQYQEPEISQQLKTLRRHCHLANEALKSVHGALPDWGKILSNLDVASNQLQLFQDQLRNGDVVLQKVAIPMHDVREGFRPAIPTILDTTQSSTTIEQDFDLLEQSPFGSMSNQELEQRKRQYNCSVDRMASESVEWRDRIKDVLSLKKQQENKVAAAATAAGVVGAPSSSSSSSSSSQSTSNSNTSLGKRQRENMQKGLEAFTYIGTPSFK